MGGKPSQGTRKDRRLKTNQVKGSKKSASGKRG